METQQSQMTISFQQHTMAVGCYTKAHQCAFSYILPFFFFLFIYFIFYNSEFSNLGLMFPFSLVVGRPAFGGRKLLNVGNAFEDPGPTSSVLEMEPLVMVLLAEA